MEKIYQIDYKYEIEQQSYIDEARPDIGVYTKYFHVDRYELVLGKTPADAMKNWKKIIAKRKETKKVYIIGIKEYIVNQSEVK